MRGGERVKVREETGQKGEESIKVFRQSREEEGRMDEGIMKQCEKDHGVKMAGE